VNTVKEFIYFSPRNGCFYFWFEQKQAQVVWDSTSLARRVRIASAQQHPPTGDRLGRVSRDRCVEFLENFHIEGSRRMLTHK